MVDEISSRGLFTRDPVIGHRDFPYLVSENIPLYFSEASSIKFSNKY